MKIPEAVIEEAREWIEDYGEHFTYHGKMDDGRDVYSFDRPEEMEVGYPIVYLYDGHVAMEISGGQALDILASFDIE